MTLDVIGNLNRRFDHTNLQPDLGPQGVQTLCMEARQYGFWSVCLNPIWVPLAARFLQDSAVKVTSVSGFPLGANRTDLKTMEAVKGTMDGANEIDMVANITWLTDGEATRARDEIAVIRQELPKDVLLKVIIECGRLTEDQQREAVMAVIDGGAEFVKSGTGFYSPVTVE
ncbi:deoxyribose-phosphate aldolase, partial [candidate division GN15 bacterium]|nr:deoxyribose-phosphate aldolase [candidate division GN15 bacterium]